MTQEKIEKYRLAAEDGSLPDGENPLFLFSTTSTNLLAKLLAKEFNVLDLVRMELANRGVNEKGQWIGFKTAQKKRRSQGKTKGI
ncbi:hypothetical protein [Dinghuibacter silviterrae]|uniref:Uncharacterized protein n=1 Tax=Dinghuibacter silviterrae TaxID=1539049 RepID=A0A4R8DRP8_9BACT|nr:hypothetical protein [Dinghuibacter silviterrae]TDX00516.1 hypothetical protein EDB95_1541 [Dinghuibacter silviterrae]